MGFDVTLAVECVWVAFVKPERRKSGTLGDVCSTSPIEFNQIGNKERAYCIEQKKT